MNRPLLIAAITLLAGVIAGAGISGPPVTAAVITLCMAVCIRMYTESRDLDQGTLLFFITSWVIIFVIGFLRARSDTAVFQAAEAAGFYEKYRATNPGEFDYAFYLKTMGVTDEAAREAMKEPPVKALIPVRQFFADILEQNLSGHDSGIYKAMLLGDKSDMDDTVKDLYQTGGIAHLLAVSGLHISLIGMGVYRIFRKNLKTGQDVSIAAASFLTAVYVLLTGASGSAVRAGLMLVINLFSRKAGRTYDPLSALCLSFIVLVLYRPYYVFQSGFQLSFGAILGIILSSGLYNGKNVSVRSLSSSFCVSAVTLPVIAANYYVFPLFSVLLNLAVIPLMTVVMVSGLLTLAAGSVSQVLAGAGAMAVSGILGKISLLSAAPGHYILKFYELLCDFSLKLPFSRIITGKPSDAGVICYYLFLYVLFKAFSGEKEKHTRWLIPAGVCLLSLFLVHREPSSAYITAVNVGQGDCFHIHSGSHDMLIDGGASGYDSVGENIIEPYLLSKGIGELDAIVVSHADSDHTNGIRYLLQNSVIRARTLILPASALSSEKYDDLKDAFSASGGSLQYLETGDVFRLNRFRLECLYCAPDGAQTADINRQSSVILAEYGDFRMLFTGDITKEDEGILLSRYADSEKLDGITVLKAAHHGSKTATGDAFISRIRPAYAVLSYRKNNIFGHPHAETLERLEQYSVTMLKTAELGAVTLVPEGKGVTVRGFKNRSP